MIDYAALHGIFGDNLPPSHVFFATVAAFKIVPGYAALRREMGMSTAHTNHTIWKAFVQKYKEQTANTPVTGLTITPETVELAPGATQQLTFTVAPADATNKKVNFVSSAPGVATVNASGLITAAGGATDGQTATITGTTEDGNKTDTCVVTIVAAQQSVTSQGEQVTMNGQPVTTGAE